MGRSSDRLPSADRVESVDAGSSLEQRAGDLGRVGIVDRSTTATDWLDVVKTGWTEQHVAGLEQTSKTKTATLPR